jgi:acetate kinase
MGVRHYGAHGLSYESIVYQLEPDVPRKLIVAHLGKGASIAAIRNGQGLDTSMGLTPLGGIISSTRAGHIDPGVTAPATQSCKLDAITCAWRT